MCECYFIETGSMFLGIEIVLTIFFYFIAPRGNKINLRSIARGVVERLFLIVALLNEYPHALALFGALKIGTRLADSKKIESSYNDYYLVGNLISVLAAIGFVYWYKLFY